MIQQTLTHASFYKSLIPDSNFPEEPKKSYVVRSGEAAADEDTRAPRRRIGARKDLM
jgi:hypothetical protein